MERSRQESQSRLLYICGAVEGASILDMTDGKPDIFVTAQRGIEEELGIKGLPKTAIKFTTLYLKFDTHEWGMGGFVDLREPSLPSDVYK
jgi:hypothetical protein